MTGTLTIAHLSDPHLDGSARRRERFEAVLRHVVELPGVDAIVVSGDLADHGRAGEYAEFFAALPAGIPMLVCAGNHDLAMPLQEAKAQAGLRAQLDDVLRLDGLMIVALDSHVDGRDDGMLDAQTLAHARRAIAEASDPVALMLHHPPVPVGHRTVDESYPLRNPDDLAGLIRDSPAVVAVFSGHVHTAFTATFAGVPVLGAPGIVSRLRLGSRINPIADPDAMPGFALHTVDGGSIRTVFHTLSPSELT